jgi:hypothetical protein
MDAHKKTAALGKRFARRLGGKPSHYTKTDLKTLRGAYLPEQKPAWTIRKDTQVVVAGLDADPLALEEARGRGIEIATALSWLGFEEAADATSIADYLRRLVASGFRFDTGCNEGEGTKEVWTVPVRRVAACARLGRLRAARRGDLGAGARRAEHPRSRGRRAMDRPGGRRLPPELGWVVRAHLHCDAAPPRSRSLGSWAA